MNTEQKTPIEWFQMLKEPYRSEAIANIDVKWNGYSEYTDSLFRAILHAFNFKDSKQGYDYWAKLRDSIVAGETTYLETETELKPQDMISGEWYVVEAFEKKTYLIKFNKFHSNSLVWIKAFDIKSKYNCNELYIHKDYNIRSIRKATREEVLEHFPDEFQDEKKTATNSIYQPLFDLMSKEHDIDLLPSEMEEIINVCEKILESRKDEKKEVESELKEGEEEVYFYSIDHINFSTSNLQEALNDADKVSTIYKGTPIGTKQTKSILEPIKTK